MAEQFERVATRTSAGSTASDGWLWFPFDSSFVLGSQHKVTSVYVRFTGIKSASGSFTGDVPIRIITSDEDFDAGYIYGYTFPSHNSGSGTTISGYLDTDSYVLGKLAAANIERVDLGRSTYADGKDIRCLDSATCTLILIYEANGGGGDDSGGSGGGGESGSYTRCTPPTTVKVAVSSTMSSTVSLSWWGAKSGENNEIYGYRVNYADSSDNVNWGSWKLYSTEFETSPGDVPTPAVGVYRKYRVWALGEAGENWKSATATESSGSVLRLQTITRCTAPTKVTVKNATTAAKTNTLSWEGATGGTNNNISGYFIQYADSPDNKTWGSWTGDMTVGVVSSTSVPMPAENTYRKFRVYTLGTAGSNWRSSTGKVSASTYRGHAELAGFTDSPLVAGQTYVKALHMQELQDRANTLRGFYGLSAYKFTTITTGETDLKNWTAHVNEIRTAIDAISKDHAAWISFSVNCPRADVIEQLRAVILAM